MRTQNLTMHQGELILKVKVVSFVEQSEIGLVKTIAIIWELRSNLKEITGGLIDGHEAKLLQEAFFQDDLNNYDLLEFIINEIDLSSGLLNFDAFSRIPKQPRGKKND